jgi:hypothetical protein
MTKIFAGAILAMAPAAFGQTTQAGIAYQQAGAIGFQTGPGSPAMITLPKMIGPEIMNPVTTPGSPFAAAQQSHSLQVLGDGTRIERTETGKYYRDSAGRTRVESGPAGSERVVIQDPVGGFIAVLDPASRTVQKLPAPLPLKGMAVRAQPAGQEKGQVSGQVTRIVTQEFRNSAGADVVFTQGAFGAAIGAPATAAFRSSDAIAKPVTDNLGTQNLGGVTAAGQKTTLTIPVGEIGNDRPILVVSETWYSNDLQMVVKSSNSDPRFGETTYSLSNINRAEQDPSLFQIPADYAISDSKTFQFKTTQPKE